MLTLQVLPGLRVAPQLLAEIAKGPVTVRLVKSSVPEDSFVIDTFFAPLLWPTTSVGKVREAGENFGARSTSADQVKITPAPDWLPPAA